MQSKTPSEKIKKSVVTIRPDSETELIRASRSSATAAKLRATYGSRTSRDYSSILKAGATSRGSTFDSFSTSDSLQFDDDSKEDDEEEEEDEEIGSEEHSYEEESSQECNEDGDEEECQDEEEVEEEETTEASLEVNEPDLDMEMRRRIVIERYLALLQRLRYTRKKNAYLDDKLYKLCVRKGYITEQDESHQDEESQTHHRGRKKQHIVLHIHSRDDLRRQTSKNIAVKSQNSLGTPTNQRSQSRVFLTNARNQERMYRHKLEHLIALGKTEVEIAETVTYHLAQLQKKFEQKEVECTSFFDTLMGRMTEESSKARHSSMGTPLNPEETRQFVEEIRSYFNKLRRTIHLFYKTWHGLNFDLEKLEEQEVKEKGLSMLEYEQLQSENKTLKDKAEYQEQELEKQRKKIASALQILAHVREKEFRIDDLLIIGFNNLNEVNSQLKVYAEQMDDVTQNFAALRGEQRDLQQQSGLMDNVKLMRDYEKTTGKLSQVQEEKRKIVMQTNGNAHEIQELQNQISLIKQNLPQLQKIAAKRAKEFKRESEVKRSEEEQKAKEHQDVEQFKLERLLQLLQLRHDEPWKEVQERMIRPDFFGATAGNLTQISC